MRITGVEYGKHDRKILQADEYVSTIPVTALAKALHPKPPDEVVVAANSLRHLSIVFVYLKIDMPSVSLDNWVYIPERHLTIHRISEFRNFSPYCAPKGKTMICAEITCARGDKIWRSTPEQLAKIAERDLIEIGLIKPGVVLDSFIKKIPYAYPVYDLEFQKHLAPVMDYVAQLENIHTTGRQGNFRYNNMDQSIEMGRKMGWELATGEQTGHQAVATGKEYFG
jgi:protoporphyrinogen oxidase